MKKLFSAALLAIAFGIGACGSCPEESHIVEVVQDNKSECKRVLEMFFALGLHELRKDSSNSENELETLFQLRKNVINLATVDESCHNVLDTLEAAISERVNVAEEIKNQSKGLM